MDGKTYLTWRDIAERHGLGETNARKRIREIKSIFPNGGDAPRGKVMEYEVDAWEYYRSIQTLQYVEIERKKSK